MPKLYYGVAGDMNSTSNVSSRFVEDGKYRRLQNVVLSYTIKSSMLERKTNGYVKSAKLFVQGQNLHVWTKYKGADPDNISALGVDAAASPQVRSWAVGISCGF